MLVCISIYLRGLKQAVFHEAASVLFFIISGRNADKCKQSLFKAFFSPLGNSNMKSCLWFSECLILVRPLNEMLIINWLSMSSFSYHKVLTVGREAHFFSWAPHGVEAPEKTGARYSMKCSVRERNSVGWHLGWVQSAMGRHWKS